MGIIRDIVQKVFRYTAMILYRSLIKIKLERLSKIFFGFLHNSIFDDILKYILEEYSCV